MNETWKDIEGYEGLYQVSNLGRLRTLQRYNFSKKKHEKTCKVLKLNEHRQGYKTTTLSKNGKRKTYLVHRLVAAAFIENEKSKPEVNHIDADKRNNCVSNLEWVTAKENSMHASKLNIKNTKKAVEKIKRRVFFYEGEKIVKIFDSGAQCARELNLNYKSLNSSLNRGYRYKGLDLRY